jgi:hypothetical protein
MILKIHESVRGRRIARFMGKRARLVMLTLAVAGCATSPQPPSTPVFKTPISDELSARLEKLGEFQDTPPRQLKSDAPESIRRYYKEAVAYDERQKLSAKQVGEKSNELTGVEFAIREVRVDEVDIADTKDPASIQLYNQYLIRDRQSAELSLKMFADDLGTMPKRYVPYQPFFDYSLFRNGDIGTFPFKNQLVQVLGSDRALVNVRFDNGNSEVVCISDESLHFELQDKATGDDILLVGEFEVAGIMDYDSVLGPRSVHVLKAIRFEDFLEQQLGRVDDGQN